MLSSCDTKSKPPATGTEDVNAWREQLTNDTILLGFRIGMTREEINARLDDLRSEGRIVHSGNRLFALIPGQYRSRFDNNGYHNFPVSLSFHFTDNGQELTSIKGIVYAPRFYTDTKEPDWDDNNLFTKASREAMGDSAFDAQRRNFNLVDHVVDQIEFFYGWELLQRFKDKYYAFPNDTTANGERRWQWLSQGRLIELYAKTDFRDAAKACLASPAKDSTDFTNIVEIGRLNYSTPAEERRFRKKAEEAASDYLRYLDSVNEAQKKESEARDQELLRKSGI